MNQYVHAYVTDFQYDIFTWSSMSWDVSCCLSYNILQGRHFCTWQQLGWCLALKNNGRINI